MHSNRIVIDCDFKETTQGEWECAVCGFIYHGTKAPHKNCAGPRVLLVLTEAADKLGVSLDDVKHYAGAVARWAAKGFKLRSPEEVTRIYETCCQPCDQNIDGRCKKCGCNVSKSRFALTNKIKMATETCPLNKWPEGNTE